MTDEPPEARRRELFAAKDGGLSVSAWRQEVVAEFGLGVETVEWEGLKAKWLPLDERVRSRPRHPATGVLTAE
jgi:hypothetical protein